MSGPKVVRIVTREEVQAICRQYLASLEDAGQQLRRFAKAHDMLDDSLSADIEQRLLAFRRLFEKEMWLDLQKQAPLAITFFQSELERIRAQAIAKAEAARSKRRRMIDAARTLIVAIEASGVPPSKSLHEVVTRASLAGDRELMALQEILNESYKALAGKTQQSTTSTTERELAQRLGHGLVTQGFSEWAANYRSETEEHETRLDALMAEIEAMEAPQTARPFMERASAIAAEPSEARRALLTDSLVLELSEHCRRRRATAGLADKLREASAALQAFDAPENREVEQQITSMIDSAAFEGADQLIARARALADSQMTKLAATARRKAVLEGLAALGYEIRDMMATAWVQNGRLVIRKPGATDYGVELGATADVSRLQLRLVGSDRPSVARSAQRDRDMETIWCTEVDQLRTIIAQSGGDLLIERGLEPGAEPVKTIAFTSPRETVQDVRRHGARQL